MPHTITTVEALRQVIAAPHPELARKNLPSLDDYARAFIARSPFLVLSTANGAGQVDASPKGDEPGFVVVEDDTTLLIPDRPGNKLAYGHLNILENPQVGLLFVLPNTRETLRVNGRAELTADPALLDALASRGKPAVLAIRVTVEECFFHCGKAFIRSGLWQPESWGEPHPVSFGEMYAARSRQGREVADAVDSAIAEDYQNNL